MTSLCEKLEESEVDSLRAKVKELSLELRSLGTHYDALVVEQVRLSKENDDFRERYGRAVANCDALERENSDLREKLSNPIPKRLAKMPLNLPLELDCGRVLLIRRGSQQEMICRQKKGEPLSVGDVVKTVPGKDGRKAALQVIKKNKKDLFFRILGSCDNDTVDRSRQELGEEQTQPG